MEAAKKARIASREIASSSSDSRNGALQRMMEALLAHRAEIMAANAEDLKTAQDGALEKRLRLTDSKFDSMCEGIKTVMELEDPLGKLSFKSELSDGLVLERVACPIGVLAIIYEARPEAGVQIACLSVKSGNALLLKGGKEAAHSNQKIYQVMRDALESDPSFPKNTIQLVESRDEVSELLKCEKYIDLVIPRGGNDLVRYVKDHTKIPVLGHADGVCHIYVDENVQDLEKAAKIVHDAKTNYPAGCNAVETLLLHRNIAGKLLTTLCGLCAQKGWITFVSETGLEGVPPEHQVKNDKIEWHHEYLDTKMSVKIVNDTKEAVDHINEHGSSHTDSIISDCENSKRYFKVNVDSAGVYVNCSTRFADGYRYGFGAEVGISTNRIHARGPVGIEGLMIYKYILEGEGQTVGEMGTTYQWTHKKLVG